MAQNDGWTAGPTVEAAPISAAYEKRTNHLYVQGADRNYTMRQVDEEYRQNATDLRASPRGIAVLGYGSV